MSHYLGTLWRVTMNPLMMKPLRVRRAARQPGAADILHELEWLGGEALVAPLPAYAVANDHPRERSLRQRRDDAGNEWIAF